MLGSFQPLPHLDTNCVHTEGKNAPSLNYFTINIYYDNFTSSAKIKFDKGPKIIHKYNKYLHVEIVVRGEVKLY